MLRVSRPITLFFGTVFLFSAVYFMFMVHKLQFVDTNRAGTNTVVCPKCECPTTGDSPVQSKEVVTPPPVEHPPALVDDLLKQLTKNKTLILWWDRGGPRFFGELGPWDRPIKEECPIECIWTTNQQLYSQADAVWFHAPTYDGLPKQPKPPGQSWIYFSHENSLIYQSLADPQWLANFDKKAGYWLDSDILEPYPSRFPNKWTWFTDPVADDMTKEKPQQHLLAWVGSNCNVVKNGRTEWLRDLMEHIDVDSYGNCLGNMPRGQVDQVGMQKLIGQYKFYLALENTNVQDYVSEKVWNAYSANSVPIYMGAPNFDEFAPAPGSYINTDDFDSPKALADYLKIVGNNTKLYNRFFDWRRQGTISKNFLSLINAHEMFVTYRCRVCLNAAGLDTKNWRDWPRWPKKLAKQ